MVYSQHSYALSGRLPTCSELAGLIRVHVLFRGQGSFACLDRLQQTLAVGHPDVLLVSRIGRREGFTVFINGALVYERSTSSASSTDPFTDRLLAWVVKQIHNARQGLPCTQTHPISAT
ncbi:hypothetical protein BOX15_Mlig014259g1 [Macrostomum lignano]|uniref:Uncharacterized protein n=2 Tax=Macrostomum lignano TaxID=282301 RepID=A0A267F9C7_9PLAT|nr:hypothetical protein BOX15_Mlig014259g1 [Macrostomum lignano]